MADPVFKKVRHGYDCAEVASFLIELNRSFEDKELSLQNEIKKLTTALAEAERKYALLEEERNAERQDFEKQIEDKSQECEKLRADIQTIEDADAHAKEIVRDANARAEEILKNAREKGNHDSLQMVSDLRQKCAVVEWSIQDFQERMDAIRDEVHKTEDLLSDAVEELNNGLKKQGEV